MGWLVKRLGLIVDGRISGSAWAVKRGWMGGVFDFREQNKAIKKIVIDHDLQNWFEFLNLNFFIGKPRIFLSPLLSTDPSLLSLVNLINSNAIYMENKLIEMMARCQRAIKKSPPLCTAAKITQRNIVLTQACEMFVKVIV